jgi:hypothetical protein
MTRSFYCSPFGANSRFALKLIHTTTSSPALNPWFITGFADGEGCFMISLLKVQGSNLGWGVKPIFQIHLHQKDLPILNCIKSYLGVGNIALRTNGSCFYSVQSIKDLEVIINHFDSYPLITQK